MKKNIIFGFMVASFVWMGVLMFNVTFAQEENEASPELDGVNLDNAVTIATVNFYDPVIKSQEGNKFNISFIISNRKYVQPGIKYGVQLIQDTEKGGVVIDEKIYNEVVSLGENDEVEKNIIYTAPDFLTGEYHLKLIGRTQDGMQLALWLFDKPVQLNGSRQYIHLKDCFVSDTDIADGAYVGLKMGMDIMPGEKLFVICEAESNFSEAINAKVQYEFFERTKFSEKDAKVVKGEQMNIVPGVTSRLIFDIPYVSQPQAYDVNIKLLDTAQKEVSNDIVAHYVLQGESATIQGVNLDKSEYKAGETAKLFFFISGNAGNFEGARNRNTDSIEAILDITLADIDGNVCAQKKVKIPTLDETERQIAGLSVTRDCSWPSAHLILKNSQGKILYETQMKVSDSKSVTNETGGTVATGSDKKDSDLFLVLLVVVFLILLLTVIGIYFYHKRKTSVPMGLLFLLFSGMFFFGGAIKNASADTYIRQNGHVTIVVNWPREQYYSPGTGVRVQAGIPEVLTCGNKIFTRTYVVCAINDSTPDHEVAGNIVVRVDCDQNDASCPAGSGLFCKICRNNTLITKTFTVPDTCSENRLYCDDVYYYRNPGGSNYWSRGEGLLGSISLGTPPCNKRPDVNITRIDENRK